MASHGIPRATVQDRTIEARQKEAKDIEHYRALVSDVRSSVDRGEFSSEVLEKTTALLKKNPEYYTIWNIRRHIFNHEFDNIDAQVEEGKLDEARKKSQVLDIINLDLQFLLPLLIKYPKCYWIWHHRLWTLQSATRLLPADVARSLWQEELRLVGKMLDRDNRNFHGWGYRRTITDHLESSQLSGSSMSRSEYDYTTKKIGENLSNFSAWHARSRLILRVLDEEKASDAERQAMLDGELELVHRALIDPYDQSLWFYHQNLMAAFDPDTSDRSMAPALTQEQRLQYVKAEQDYIEEILEDVEGSKWVYQASMDCIRLEGKLMGEMPVRQRDKVKECLFKLKQLDPLRTGRWDDLSKSLL